MSYLVEKQYLYGIHRLVCLKISKSIGSPLREVQNICLLPHIYETIVMIYDAFEWPTNSQKWWIEMEPVLDTVPCHELQLFRGLDYLHTLCRLSHRDLHGGNVLINDMKILKIIYLGKACSPDNWGNVGKNCNF